MMEVQRIRIRRESTSRLVVVSVQDIHGEWRDIGKGFVPVSLLGSMYLEWELPEAWREGERTDAK